jgi:hypothetical protein
MTCEWVSVQDRLPELFGDWAFRESCYVLATDGVDTHVCYLRGHVDDDWGEPRWYIRGRDAYTFDGVIAWCTLPPLPSALG